MRKFSAASEWSSISEILSFRTIGCMALLLSCAACFIHSAPAPVPPPPPISVNYVEKLIEQSATVDSSQTEKESQQYAVSVAENTDTSDMMPVIMQEVSRQTTENMPCRDMTNLSVAATRIMSESHPVGAVIQQQSNFNVNAEETYLTCDALPQ